MEFLLGGSRVRLHTNGAPMLSQTIWQRESGLIE
jgi:hypothetical protein